MPKIIIPAALALSFITIAPAFAGDDGDCAKAPRDQWLSKEAITARVSELGYKVRRVKVEDGCYEVYAFDKNGARAEIYIDPVSGRIMRAREDD